MKEDYNNVNFYVLKGGKMKNIIPSSKKGTGATNAFLILAAIMVVAVLGIAGFYIYNTTQQTAAVQEEKAQEAVTGPTTLQGKAVTLSVRAYNQGTDDKSTKVAAPLYLFENAITSPDGKSVTGLLDADGTTLSTTSTLTQVTDGVAVGDKVKAIASNNTWYGIWSDEITLNDQTPTLDLNVYQVMVNGKVTYYDDNDNSINVVPGITNLSIGASETYTMTKIKIENNNSNVAWNVAGFWLSQLAGDNITSYTMDGSFTGSNSKIAGTVKKDSSKYTMDSRSNVDEVFVFDKPILLQEYDYIYTPSYIIKGDGDGCAANENIATLKVFDANWFRSSKETAVKFGTETDADSPADVGASDYQAYAVTCSA